MSRCLPDSLGEISSIPWNNAYSIEVGNGKIIRAKVKFQYSLLGKIYKTLFRSPPVMMKISYVGVAEKVFS